MIFSIAKFIANTFGLDISKVQRVIIWLVIGIVGTGLLIAVFSLRSCFHKEPKIDQESINKINKSNEADAKKEIEKVVTENQDVINTVDNRTAISDADIYDRDREIQRKVYQVEQEVQAAKQQGKDVTPEYVKCLLGDAPQTCTP